MLRVMDNIDEESCQVFQTLAEHASANDFLLRRGVEDIEARQLRVGLWRASIVDLVEEESESEGYSLCNPALD